MKTGALAQGAGNRLSLAQKRQAFVPFANKDYCEKACIKLTYWNHKNHAPKALVLPYDLDPGVLLDTLKKGPGTLRGLGTWGGVCNTNNGSRCASPFLKYAVYLVFVVVASTYARAISSWEASNRPLMVVPRPILLNS